MIATRRSLNFTVPLVLDPPRHCGLSSIALVPGRHLLGSAPDCDIRLGFAGVQPRHAIILVGENRTIVKSMDARTWVNDGPLTEMALRPGDRLSVGPVTFRVRSASKDEIAAFETENEDSGKEKSAVEADLSLLSYASLMPEAVIAPFVQPTAIDAVQEVVADSLEPVVVNSIVDSPAIDSQSLESTTVSPVEETPVEVVSLDARLDEIQQRLAELELTATSATRPADSHNSENALWVQSLRMREADLLRRAEQLAVDTEHLQERSALVVTHEAQLEQQRYQLTLEAERIAEVAESTRRSLSQEHSQHLSVWQDWEAAYQRMTSDVTSQLDSVEKQRQALQDEADRLSLARTELQRVRIEYEQLRKATETAQQTLTQDRAEFTNLRSQFETHRAQYQREVEEQRRQVAAARRELDLGRTELTLSLQQLERDRQVVMAERLEQVKRLEVDNQRRTSIQSELEEERRRLRADYEQLSAQQADLRRQQIDFDEQQTRAALNNRDEAEVAERKYNELLQQFQQLQHELLAVQQAPSIQVAPEEPRPIGPVVESFTPEALDDVISSLTILRTEPAEEVQVPTQIDSQLEPTSVVDVPMTASVDSPESGGASMEPDQFGSGPTGMSDSIWSLSATQTCEHREFPTTSTETSVASLETPSTPIFPSDWMSHARPTGPAGLTTRSQDPWGLPDLAALSGLSMSLHPTTSPESSLNPTGIDPWGSFTPSIDLEVESSAFQATAIQLAPPPVEVAKKVGELEADSTATPHFDPLTNQQLTADQTLAVVNRDFGVPIEEESPAPAASTLPSWWVETPKAEAPDEDFKVEQPGWAAEAMKADAPDMISEPAPSPAVGNNSADLRSTLAMLFDLPATATSDSLESNQLEKIAESPADVIEGAAAIEDLTEASATAEDVVSESSDSAEDSVEEFMARLLARSRGDETKPSTPVVASAPVKAPKAAAVEDDSVSFTMPTEADRSHLMAAPKHKQDKQAVRDNLKSFRQVAHLSARSALARHSLQQLRNATIAKGILLGAASIATMWFFAHPLWGREIQMWKAGACALAALLSAVEFSRSWTQLFKPLTAPGSANTTTEPTAEDSMADDGIDDAPVEVVVEAPVAADVVTTETPSEESPA